LVPDPGFLCFHKGNQQGGALVERKGSGKPVLVGNLLIEVKGSSSLKGGVMVQQRSKLYGLELLRAQTFDETKSFGQLKSGSR
jgi:hypothetical protein